MVIARARHATRIGAAVGLPAKPGCARGYTRGRPKRAGGGMRGSACRRGRGRVASPEGVPSLSRGRSESSSKPPAEPDVA